MDFTVNIDNIETTFTQFDDVMEHIKQALAQWNNFDDTTQPKVVVVIKTASDTLTLGINAGEVVDVEDVFGGR